MSELSHLPRERATHDEDLPHAYDPPTRGATVCKRCGRSEKHDLHAVEAREVASAESAILPREIGT